MEMINIELKKKNKRSISDFEKTGDTSSAIFAVK